MILVRISFRNRSFVREPALFEWNSVEGGERGYKAGMFLGDCPVPLGEVLREGFSLGRGRGIQPADGIPILRVALENGQQDEGHCTIFFPIGAVRSEMLSVFPVIGREACPGNFKIVLAGSLDLIGVVT